jgi:NAD(P)-dependent dehydrogenase (short-subunit alcohol dehydrogenase family)
LLLGVFHRGLSTLPPKTVKFVNLGGGTMNIAGAVAFVTGTNRGIGAQLVKALQVRGAAKIYAASRRGATTEAGVIHVKLDITKPDEVTAAATMARDTTLLINNAGVNFNTPLLNPPTVDNARAEMAVNYFGTLAMCQAFAPILGTNGGGAIVNMLSILSRVNLPLMGSLCASKAAALSLTQGVRAQLAQQGTLVIAVMPGAVDTDMTKDFPPPKIPPLEVAKAVLDAIEAGMEEIYPGDMAQGIAQRLAADPKGVEKELARYLPG